MRTLPTIIYFCFFIVVSITLFGQSKKIAGIFYTTGYYSGLKLNLKPNLTFTLKYHGHISSDTTAGVYKIQGDTIFLRYDYNNYDTIFAYYKEHNEEVPIDIQLTASRVILRPKILVKKRSMLYVLDEETGQLKTYGKNDKMYLVYLKRAK